MIPISRKDADVAYAMRNSEGASALAMLIKYCDEHNLKDVQIRVGYEDRGFIGTVGVTTVALCDKNNPFIFIGVSPDEFLQLVAGHPKDDNKPV